MKKKKHIIFFGIISGISLLVAFFSLFYPLTFLDVNDHGYKD